MAPTSGYGGPNRTPPTRITVKQIEQICGCNLLYTGDVPLFPNVEKLINFAGR